MTEKRFRIKNSNIVEDGYFIKDNVGSFSFPTTTDGSDLIMYEKHLNELSEENEQLKQQLRIFEDGLKSEIKETKIAMEDWNECLTDCRKLKKENEQLKQLADGNEELLLKVMTYLHDKYYDLWEEVNTECFKGDVE